jgi:hypothetical protein
MWILLLRNWKLVGIGLVILACALYVGALKVQMQYMTARISRLEDENARRSAHAAELQALIETQNGYISAWKAAGVENAKLRQAAEKRAAQIASQAAVLPLPTPPHTNAEKCLERDSWLRSELNSLLWR